MRPYGTAWGSLLSPPYKITVTVFECILFSEITEKNLDNEGVTEPSDILSKDGASPRRSVMLHACYNGKNPFYDSAVVCRICFEKVFKYKNVHLPVNNGLLCDIRHTRTSEMT